MVSFSHGIFFAVSLLRIPLTIVWACIRKLAWGISLQHCSTGIKALNSLLLVLWSTAMNGTPKKIPIWSKSKLNGNNISFTCNSSFSVVSNSAKSDANGFFKVASFEFATSCQKIKVWYMRSNGIFFLATEPRVNNSAWTVQTDAPKIGPLCRYLVHVHDTSLFLQMVHPNE